MPGIFPITPLTQWALAFVGMVAFVLYARSWKDAAHLWYDLPASIMVFAFIAQVLLEAIKGQTNGYWLARMILIVALTAAIVGREFWRWPLSGHLTCVFAVALVQTVDPRISALERCLYWAPVPLVLLLRWWQFDGNDHWQTYHAIIAAVVFSLPVMLVARCG